MSASRRTQSLSPMLLRTSLWAWLVTVALLRSTQPAYATPNLLNNGNFSIGSGNSVDGWRTEAWVQDEGSTDYHWIAPTIGRPGEVELFSHRDNDARWQQPISLAPGWYHISAEARAHRVLNFSIGANISVLDGDIMSADLKGDTDWQKLGFYLKVGPHGADVDVCLRLGGYGNLTRGQAFFRHVRVEKVAEPPPGAEHVFDLTEVRKAQITPPLGRPWTLWMTLVFFTAIGVLGWWLMSEPIVKTAASVPAAMASPVHKRRKRARAR
jgi:hypothetical protein